MKQLIILTVLVVIAVGAGMVVTAKPGDQLYSLKAFFSGTQSYVTSIDDTLDSLEADLAQLEADISTGRLNEVEAATAKAKIVARLDSINAAIDGAGSAEVTPAMRAQLSAALDRLTTILTTYRDSLVVVDDLVKKSKRGGGSGGSRSLLETAADIIDVVVDHIEEVTEEEVVLDDSVNEAFDLDSDEESDESMEETNSDESVDATSTKKTSGDTSEDASNSTEVEITGEISENNENNMATSTEETTL